MTTDERLEACERELARTKRRYRWLSGASSENRYRDIYDPNDPYWLRVRRVHFYLWAKGVLAGKTLNIMMFSVMWLLMDIFFMALSLLWRGVAIAFVILGADYVVPGYVTCVFQGSLIADWASGVLGECTQLQPREARIATVVVLALITIALLLPIRRRFKELVRILFMITNILSLGYVLRGVAFLTLQDTLLASKFLGHSFTIGLPSVSMPPVLPAEYGKAMDELWDKYLRTENPQHLQQLEQFLETWEAKILDALD